MLQSLTIGSGVLRIVKSESFGVVFGVVRFAELDNRGDSSIGSTSFRFLYQVYIRRRLAVLSTELEKYGYLAE